MTVVPYKNVKRPIIPVGDLPMLALFARGEQGAWYDPSDLYNYMAAGEEMIPDPRFSTPASWVLDPAHTIENGTLLFNATSGSQVVEPAGEIRTIAGLTYEVVIDLTRTSGSFLVRGFGISYIQSGSSQRVVQHLVGNGGVIGLRTYSGGVAEVREFSVRPVHGIGQATMFQDAAGTVPVTGVEQPVGLILDKSGNGNHASQLTTTARPMLSARVNLLQETSNVIGEVWRKVGVSVSGKVIIPGAASAVCSSASASQPVLSTTFGGPLTVSARASSAGLRYLSLGIHNTAGYTASALFDLETGEVHATGSHPLYVTPVGATIRPLGNGEYACSFTMIVIAGASINVYASGTSGPAGLYARSIIGDGVSGVNVEDLQVEFGSVATKYQRVKTATDYDWQGWPLYLTSDGVDDALSANGAGLAMDRDAGTTLACGYEYGYMAGVTGAANVATLTSGTSAVVYVRLGQRADHSEGRVASATMRNSNALTPAIATASVARNIKPNAFEVGVVRTREQTIRHRLRDGAEAVAEFTGDASLATDKIDMFSPGSGVRRIFGALVVMRELDDGEVDRLTNFLTERATRAKA